MATNIALPGGARVPAARGKYRVVPPPDLNKIEDARFLLEYDFPFLLVREMATTQASEEEKGNAIAQVERWKMTHYSAGGRVGYDRAGYQFNKPTGRHARGYRRQLIPDISYIDARAWSHLTDEEKQKAYKPCTPAVVIELMSATDRMADLQAKVDRFIRAGTREGVIVDTRRDQVWIHNKGQQPYFDVLAPVEFDSWPGFVLDCTAIKQARLRAE